MSTRELPMMPWYPDQFAATVAAAGWTWAEEALYRKLLDAQWQAGTLSCDEKVLSRIARMDVRTFRKLWSAIKSKFETVAPGQLQNKRLEEHRLKSRELADAKRRGAETTNQKRWSHSDRSASRTASRTPVADESPLISDLSSRKSKNPLTPAGGGTTANGSGSRGRRPNRDLRDQSRRAWHELLAAMAQIMERGQSWTALKTYPDALLFSAGDAIGFMRIRDRDRFTEKKIMADFREVYERLAAGPPPKPPTQRPHA